MTHTELDEAVARALYPDAIIERRWCRKEMSNSDWYEVESWADKPIPPQESETTKQLLCRLEAPNPEFWRVLDAYSQDDDAALSAVRWFSDMHDISVEWGYWRGSHQVAYQSNINGSFARGKGSTFAQAAAEAISECQRAIDDKWIGWHDYAR